MRSFAISLFGALSLALAAPVAATAQEGGYTAPRAPSAVEQRQSAGEMKAQAAALAKGRERGMAEAPALIQATGRTCTVTDATFRGSGKGKGPDGKDVTTNVYEVACQEGLGYIVVKAGEATPTANDCLVHATVAAKSADPSKQLVCTLSGNANPAQGLQPLVTQSGVRCTVAKARAAGESETSKFTQYEVACSEGGAYYLQVPQPGSTSPLRAVDCVIAAGQGAACEYMPQDQVTARIKTLAAPAGRQCEINNARYVAKSDKSTFYEVGCTDPNAGFMFETDPSGKFMRAIDCVRAGPIAGGCTFSAAVGDTDQAGLYTKLAREIGFDCAVSKYRSFGLDPQRREVVELACTNRPAGAVAFLPTDKAQKGEYKNCVRASANGLKCGFTSDAATFALLTSQITAKGKSCKVSNARGMGTAADGTDYVEVSCSGEPGLVLHYAVGSDNLSEAVACLTAKGVGGGCKLQ